MNSPASFVGGKPLATLRRFTQSRSAGERCELCSLAIPSAHRHLLQMERREIVCTCDACALRFEGVLGGRYKLIPRDTRVLRDFRLAEGTWERFALPINLAFFFFSTAANKMAALYPSPAGATESLLPLDAWSALAADNPALHDMQPDVEALLINRVASARQYFIAPIDVCFELVGLIRREWRGLSGGEAVWERITAFFRRLDGPIEPAAEVPHA